MRLLFFLILFLSAAFPIQAAEENDVLVNGTSMHYIRAGRGIPVVLVHGTYSSLNVFRMSIFDKVSEKYDVTAIDLPGYGQSGRPRLKMTFDERVEMVHAAIEKLGIEKPVLAGHSSGGAFALRYAMKYPNDIRALALVSPYTEPYEKANKIYRTATFPFVGNIFYYTVLKPVKFFRRDWAFAKPGFDPDPVNREYASKEVDLALRRKTFRANAYDLQTLGPVLVDMDKHYGDIKVPVVIVTGAEDKISIFKTNGEILHKKIPHSKLILLPKTGHNPLFTKPNEVLDAIDLAAN